LQLSVLKNYFYKGKIKSKEFEYNSIGPIAEIQYFLNERLSIKLYGVYEIITHNVQKREQTVLNIRLLWDL